MKIDEMMKEIDCIINELKDSNSDIDKSIDFYKKGMELIEKCLIELEEKKIKIKTITGEDFNI